MCAGAQLTALAACSLSRVERMGANASIFTAWQRSCGGSARDTAPPFFPHCAFFLTYLVLLHPFFPNVPGLNLRSRRLGGTLAAPLCLARALGYRVHRYKEFSTKEKTRCVREVTAAVLSRPAKQCNFIDWRANKIVYKRYASLYFIASIDGDDNELITLEMIHLFVEVLDRYFGNVCELDIIFNFHKAYYILDELFIGGLLQETSKKEVLKVCALQDDLMEETATEGGKKKKLVGT